MDSNKPNHQNFRSLKKGELLFVEGEKSRAMYLVKSGSIRLFMKRGRSDVELSIVGSGQILGELAFLDGNPRSASGEAVSDCEIMEISGSMFLDVLNQAPEWLKILLKTVVGRLRTTTTRLRQLESANVVVGYSKDGTKPTTSYQFLSLTDFMKVLTALLLVGSRKVVKGSEGTEVALNRVNGYSNGIMAVPLVKTSCVVDILCQAGVAKVREEKGISQVTLKDLNCIENIIEILKDEYHRESTNRREISKRGFQVMSLMMKHATKFKRDVHGMVVFNLVEIREAEGGTSENPIFRAEDVNELFKHEFIREFSAPSDSEIRVVFHQDEFYQYFVFCKVLQSVKDLNEQKRTVAVNTK